MHVSGKRNIVLSALRNAATLLSFILLPLLPASAGGEDGIENASQAREYTLWYRNYDNRATLALVKLALSHTPEYGEFSIRRSKELTQGRALKELADTRSSTRLDIANVATTAEREDELNEIPVPVDGGLLGFRVCLILPKNLEKFENVNSMKALRESNISIGQGAHWPDTAILKSNGIQVVTHTRYEILFGMLRNDRFDCFARGISEVLYDKEAHDPAEKALVIEPHLLLAYPMPSYLFTAPDDSKTAQRLRVGLERAIQDGSFGDYLETWYGRPVAELGLDQRAVIILENPFLSEASRNVGRRALEDLDRRIKRFQDR
jgi:hypothetical protein